MICPKCGEKNKEGAQFCTKCGEKLGAKSKEKTTKTATGKAATKTTVETTKTAKNITDDVKELTKEVTKEMTSEASNIIRDMVNKPIDSLKTYGDEKRFNLALVLVGIMSILLGLFIVLITKNLYSEIMATINSYMGSFMYGMTSNNSTAEIPYIKVFFYSTIAAFALSFVFVGILYFVNNVLFKGTENFKKTYVIYGIISIVESAALLASIVLSFLSIKLTFIVLSLGLTLSSFYKYHMIRIVGPKDENKHGYIYVITTLLFYIATYILIKLIVL